MIPHDFIDKPPHPFIAATKATVRLGCIGLGTLAIGALLAVVALPYIVWIYVRFLS